MLEFSKGWAAVGGLLVVPFLAVLVVSTRHDPGGSETPREPTASGTEPRRTSKSEPEIPRVAAAPATLPPAAAAAPDRAQLDDDSQRDDRTEADIERKEKAIAALNQMRQLVAEGWIPASSMTSVELIDVQIEGLNSGRTMPDPAVSMPIRARVSEHATCSQQRAERALPARR